MKFYDTIHLGVIANIQKDQNIFQEGLDYFENYTARWKWVNVITQGFGSWRQQRLKNAPVYRQEDSGRLFDYRNTT